MHFSFPQVSTGVTLRENNLKEIKGGTILESQGVLVANKRSLKEDPRLLQLVRELIERFEVRPLPGTLLSLILETPCSLMSQPCLRGQSKKSCRLLHSAF